MSQNSNEKNIFGVIKWHFEDLRTICPDWTDYQCEQFIAKYEDIFRQRQIEEGWKNLKTLIKIYDRKR